MFAPLSVARRVLVVAPEGAGGGPEPEGLRAFSAGPAQAINYHPGTWHHPVFVLDEPAELLMLTWEDGSAGDCETRVLAEPVEVG